MKILLMMLKNGSIQYYSEYDKRPLPIGINKKEIDFFKDELGGTIVIEFVGLYLMYVRKRAKGTLKCILKK